jgi:hypothetical protein
MPSSFLTVEAETETEDANPTVTATQTSTDELVLDGAPIPAGRIFELTARGRTIKHAFHPVLSEGQAWIGEKHVNARTQSSFVVSTAVLPVPYVSREQVRRFFPRNLSSIPLTCPSKGSRQRESR